MTLLLFSVCLGVYDIFYSPDTNHWMWLLWLSISLNLLLQTPTPSYQYPEVDNPFDRIHMDQGELVMKDARFKVDKVKQVIIQPTRRNGQDVGYIFFFRNYRNGRAPDLTFNINYIDELKAFIGEHMPNTEVIQDEGYSDDIVPEH